MTFEQGLRLAISLGLMALMLSTGLSVVWGDLRNVLARGRVIAAATVVNFVAVPALTLGLIWLAKPAPAIALGFLALALTPGAPVSPAITGAARGDVPFAVGLMVLLGLISVVLTPPLLGWGAALITPDSNVAIPIGKIVQTLLLVQIVPLAGGILVRHRAPKAAQRWVRLLRLLGNVLLLFVVAALIGPACKTLAMVRWVGWIAMSALMSGCLVLGWWSGGRTRGERAAAAVTAAVRNVAAALVVAEASVPGTLAPPTVLAYGLASTAVVLLWAIVCGRITQPGGE